MVRYRVVAEHVARNVELVEAVYAELAAAAPAGFEYTTLQLSDGVSFVHVAAGAGPLPGLTAFERFRAELADRAEHGPEASAARVVGRYRPGS